jgi:predicted N-acyltransferase
MQTIKQDDEAGNRQSRKIDFDIRIVHSVEEVDQAEWDALGGGKPFSSHRWYRYGEKTMSDCIPVYILLYQQDQLLARATFWVIRNEPLPLPPGPLRIAAQAILKRWPLFICRSPLSNSSGLALPDPPLRNAALAEISTIALRQAALHHSSMLAFDYLDPWTVENTKWPEGFAGQKSGDPGTVMEIVWPDYESYLNSLTPKTRKNFRRYCREAERRGLTIRHWPNPTRLDEAETLIRNVEERYREIANPWHQAMLTNFPMVGGTLFTAELKGRLVGCELVLGDGGAQFVTALGLDYSEPNTYFLLNYADVRHAIESGTRNLHWGSGAYEVKKRQGFKIDHNENIVFKGVGTIPGLLARLAART